MDFTGKDIKIRLTVLIIGLFLYALGICFTIKAAMGISPWDVFHTGLAGKLGLSYGRISQIVGVAIIFLNYFLKEKLGLGTILNAVLIGFFADIIFSMNLIKTPEILPLKVVFLFTGMLIIAFATPLYISAGLGSGPRDGLMVALTKLTGRDVAIVRNLIEFTVFVLGFILGGKAGIGTILVVIFQGIFVRYAFKLTGFDIRKIKPDYLDSETMSKVRAHFGR